MEGVFLGLLFANDDQYGHVYRILTSDGVHMALTPNLPTSLWIYFYLTLCTAMAHVWQVQSIPGNKIKVSPPVARFGILY